jgi:hypothetical protein
MFNRDESSPRGRRSSISGWVEIICKLGTLHPMGLQKLGNTHSGNEGGEVGAQLQIYANVKEDGMVII